jgi:hypothetical protein
MIEGAGAHVNEDFTMSEMRFRYVGVVQNTGVTVLMELQVDPDAATKVSRTRRDFFGC